MIHPKDLTGIVLAGGMSSRMGRDKGLIALDGKTMTEHVIEKIKPYTSSILIVANNPEYNIFGYPVVKDIIENCGPLGGIYTGLLYSQTLYSLVMSCDTPVVSKDLLEVMTATSSSNQVIVPVTKDGVHPLCGIYSRRCAEIFARQLQKGQFKITDALEGLRTEYIPADAYADSLININSPEDLKKLKKRRS